MDTDELESLLDGAEETDRLEFKRAIAWDRNGLVKDILAMANVQDGGRIVIGVQDGSFEREGMTDEQIETYKIDDMRDQIAPFADPRVEFGFQVASDRNHLKYVVIDVHPFEEVPVICKRDGADVQSGTIYFRSRAQKPQSARVNNASDMREIIDRAVVRSLQAKRRLGFTVVQEAHYDYDAELGGL